MLFKRFYLGMLQVQLFTLVADADIGAIFRINILHADTEKNT